MKTGFAVCGSFCTFSRALAVLETLAAEGGEIVPIMSFNAASTDTRFGHASEIRSRIRELCGREPITDIAGAEPLGPRDPLDIMVICPCTGNTLGKLAGGITDTPVTMAAKAHLRSDKPLVIAAASNDALSANLGSIAVLLNRKNIFFVPMVQDDCEKKPHSLVADFSLVNEAMHEALAGRQLRPLFR